ncbi:MAG: cation transporter [Deltaproteobacteria bacterium]|nr:cation transporter [Deltaproteobacteria bacterium]
MVRRIEWTIHVGGMTCRHCAKSVDDAVREVPGVVESATRHDDGRCIVLADSSVTAAALIAAVESAGYQVVSHSSREPLVESWT